MAATVHRSDDDCRARIGGLRRPDGAHDLSTALNIGANRFEWRRADRVLQ
jgi:hypothetical protein